MRHNIACIVLAVVMATCGARQRPTAPVPTPPPKESPSRQGVTDVRILAQPELRNAGIQARVEGVSPAYSVEDNALPPYPAPAASCPDGAVAIRVTRATLFREVPDHPNQKDECQSFFWQATVAAMRDWQFIPASRQVRRESADVGGDGKPDYTWTVPEPVTVYVDLEFGFRIVEGQGEVVSR